MIKIYCDGFVNLDGIRGGCSVAVFNEDKKIFHKVYKFADSIKDNVRELLSKTKESSYTYEFFAMYIAVNLIKNNFNNRSVVIYNDNKAVVLQMNNKWKCHDSVMGEFKDFLLKILDGSDVEIIWINREEIVKVLGH